ncbi:hypothetical protein MSAN_01221600 [Mycena sanguinolenta]|uniref:Uncharacterized protein n=1 Tax=Mycena sanguinolenta TaxID=230812 RepID=A0A8H6YIZ7_9AGAR|nr:hypothetical protein MSAN_01221600 [Mycena sanguinolenta]
MNDERVNAAVAEVQAATAAARTSAERAIRDTVKTCAELADKLARAEQRLADLGETSTAKVNASAKELSTLRHCLRAMKKRVRRLETGQEKIKNGSASGRAVGRVVLKKGRAYKPEIRDLARVLISCGCKMGKVGGVIEAVARIFGIELQHTLSRRTVGRIALEGLLMARMQLGFELKHAEDYTISSDSTSRRKLNYQSHHIHMRVPVGRDAQGNIVFSKMAKVRFAGVESTPDHSAATSKATWLKVFDDVMEAFNGSPLAQRVGALDFRLICRRLRGMCGDHANVEKSVAEEMRKEKHEQLLQELGERRLAELDGDLLKLTELMVQFGTQKIEAVGGWDAWNALPLAEQAARDTATLTAMIRSLGEEALDALDDADRHLLTVWVWSGCCMHKDQNSFKGGNTAMTAYWTELDVRPIPLANKDAAQAIRKILHPEAGDKPITDEDYKRLEEVAFGGAKLTALAGAVLNNALDKRGQGDAYQLFMEHFLDVERVKSFPKTNNTRFGSHGEAAVELLVNLDAYRQFLDVIRIRKDSQTWTNIEKNVAAGLKDPPTLTELAVLALYHVTISAPYMRAVRQDEDTIGLNAITLRPFHRDICDHCQALIDNPDLWLDFDPEVFALATFDGKTPARPELLHQIKQLNENGMLPHLDVMFPKFLEGALATWIRFSSEFVPGGVIDGLTDADKQRIWLPATNDRNEGALGGWVVWAQNNPTGALHTHNGLGMYRRNGTYEFCRTFFTPEDHKHVVAAARVLEGEKLEKKRRQMQKEWDARLVAEKEQAKADKAAREAAIQSRLDAVPLIESADEILARGMTNAKLDDQLEKLRRLWNSGKHHQIDIPNKSALKTKPKKQAALQAAFTAHLALLEEQADSVTLEELFGEGFDYTEDSEMVQDEYWESEDDEMAESWEEPQ